MSGLSITGLRAGYPRRQIIHGLTVSGLQPGEVAMLLGPNGCGKSTLLRALAGLNRASGEVRLAGADLLSLTPARRAERVVFLPQSLPPGVHLQVMESVIVARRASGARGAGRDREEALTLLAALGIAHLAMCYLDELSGGQKQLVGLAQSLIRRPSLLLLDEPLSALDLNHQFTVMDLIRRETRQRGIVTVVVVHDINIALHHGDRVLMLKEGELVASGTPEAVINADNLAQVYGVRARVERCSRGKLQAILDGIV